MASEQHQQAQHEREIWKHGDYRSVLQGKFDERRARNRGYSLRAFARDLGMTASSLSLVSSGKRRLSIRRAHLVAPRLGLGPAERSYFVDLVESASARDPERRKAARRRVLAARSR